MLLSQHTLTTSFYVRILPSTFPLRSLFPTALVGERDEVCVCVCVCMRVWGGAVWYDHVDLRAGLRWGSGSFLLESSIVVVWSRRARGIGAYTVLHILLNRSVHS